MNFRRLKLMLTAILAGLLMTKPVSADHLYLSEAQLEKLSDVIVTGEYLGHAALKLSAEAGEITVGVIKVEKNLKGNGDAKMVLLMLPPQRPSGMRMSNEMTPQVDQKGLWYLKKKPNGLYSIDRPDRFVPMDRAQERIDKFLAK